MTDAWKDDDELFALAKAKLFVALVGDVLDRLGFQHQFLPPRIKPITTGTVLIGRAMTVLEADFFAEKSAGRATVSQQPFGRMFEALDDLRRNEIYICTGSSPRYALWGGLMSTRAIKCGAAGAVVDGYHRDSNEIERLGFAVASMGSYAQDQGPRGKVVDWRVPIEIEGVRIDTGDVIFGDRDGVLVVPAAVVEPAFAGAFEKARTENRVLKALQDGMTTVAAFEKFGVM
jgi:4-hydroxy-4-methyl-2-oxoglutarate aldolase